MSPSWRDWIRIDILVWLSETNDIFSQNYIMFLFDLIFIHVQDKSTYPI